MQIEGSDLPVLIGQTGPLNGRRWLIDRLINLGRESDCEVAIPDRQVSRYHARLIPGKDGVLLEDLASKNGTYHNGKRISEPVYVQDGDALQVALVQTFVFLNSDTTMPMDLNLSSTHSSSERLFLDEKARRVWVHKLEVNPSLSVPQFRLLKALYDQQGKVVSRQELIMIIWEDEEALGVSEQALDALVRRLRDRLAALDPNHQFIVTVRGYGLRLDNKLDLE